MEGECSLRLVGKELFPNHYDDIFPVLNRLTWIYKRATWLPHQPHIAAGHLAMREVLCTDGQIRPQTLATPKGRTKLAAGLKGLAARAATYKLNPVAELGSEVVAILKRAGYLEG